VKAVGKEPAYVYKKNVKFPTTVDGEASREKDLMNAILDKLSLVDKAIEFVFGGTPSNSGNVVSYFTLAS
jgi:hypothetical protein